jgi:hypothetical protein
MNTYKSVAVLLCVALLSACGEEQNRAEEIIGPAPGARIRFFNFGVGAPQVNFYANERKMTGVLSTTGSELTTGVAYGAAAAGGFYSAIDPGQYTLSGRIAATIDKDLAISSLPATFDDGKHYSFYQSGFYNATTKTVDAFIVEDAFVPQIDYSTAYVRVVHAISNANPMTLYAKNPTTGDSVAIGGEVAYKGAGAFTPLPSAVYDLTTRYTGSNTAVITRTAVSFGFGRVYTITARGDITVTSTTAATRPILENNVNR